MDRSSQIINPVTTVTGLVREIRPWQWYKQGVMLLGIVFSQNLLNWGVWLSLLIGIVSFTTVASATYIFNDISDLEEDRNHPQKQHRPIASGQVSVSVAAVFGLILAGIGLGAAYSLGPLFLAILLAYLAQNALYSLVLKQFVFVDVLIVAIGFVLRAIAGVIAIDVFLSPWLIVSTFLLALVLAFGKRRNELEVAANPQQTRDVLGEYSENNIDQLLVMVMATLLMSYSLYTFSRTDPTMMVTLPFAFFGVFRYHHLVHTTNIAGQPEYLLTDRSSVVNLILWGIVVVAVLYNVPEMAVGVIQ
ncbi:decaprenyl-phosphate phosphoribosyltransferase [Halorubrum sp. SS7]|uniref:decaprenyl-phosphate phosphoribosyltransferase n=1 Tax=unclassified Halorubrum TaxID=2642239 RepID=UPI0010F68C79|nr:MULTISPECIES: decaprenyl-phosphate phosphoribosyltransferase [unclassified Halorubrum]TKX58601.1 decaprenyl-phosphate phosphoribosyltransferase [Halorubrum sp. SS7]TKX64611.1 decaprenyl-phosphate phosphoribosyltransferase [Halorubrum sp. SP9]